MKVNEIIRQCNELLEDEDYFLQTIELTKDEVKVLLGEIERLNNKLDIQEKKFKKCNKSLNGENHRLNNTIKEVREYVNKWLDGKINDDIIIAMDRIVNILDMENKQ